MKKIFLLSSVVAISSILPSVALASDAARPVNQVKTSKSMPAPKQALKPQQAPKPKSVFVTGSYIKQAVRSDGSVPSGPSPLRVIDSREIQNSGASDLVQLLVRRGYNR